MLPTGKCSPSPSLNGEDGSHSQMIVNIFYILYTLDAQVDPKPWTGILSPYLAV